MLKPADLPARILTILTVFALVGCGASAGGGPDTAAPVGEGSAMAAEGGTLPSGHPTVEARSMTEIQSEAMTRTGIVQELLAGGGYTYARVKVGESEMWIAGPQTPLEVGQKVAIAGATSMGAFNSPSLDRSFDELWFVGAFQPEGPPPNARHGEILEVLEGGGYTYLRVRLEGGEQWLAGPATVAAEGDTALWQGGMDMGEFYSASLDRTFDSVIFVGRFWVEAR